MRMPQQFTEWTNQDIETLRSLVASGLSLDETARHMGRSLWAVKAAKGRYSVRSGPRTGPRAHVGTKSAAWTPEDTKKVWEMAMAGHQDAEIGRALGRSRDAIACYRSRNSIPTNAVCNPREWRFRRVPQESLRLNSVDAVMSLRPLNPSETHPRIRAAASIAHAIDFKRARHVYGQGELAITPDCNAVTYRPERPEPMSCIGSSAAMCVG